MGETDTEQSESFGDYCIWAVIIMALTLGIIGVWIAYLIERLIERLKGEHECQRY